MLDLNYKQIAFLLGIADSTISRVKKRLLLGYKEFMSERVPVALGGIRQIVEVDESVISRRGIIRNPTTHDDCILDTIWILGAVDRNTPQNFILKKIPDRRIESLTSALEGKIRVNSEMHTDGHPSYPAVANNLAVNHKIVNHSRGFRSEDRTHTNGIEGFWAHLKTSMRKEHGVKRDDIDDWLIQYTFKRRFLMNCDREEIKIIYSELLKYYFNKI